MHDAQKLLRDLFEHYSEKPADMPEEWGRGLGAGQAARARRIADFIAGMTDTFAREQHRRFFAATPDLR
jgi:dGTPase